MIEWLKKYAHLGSVRQGWKTWSIYRKVLLLGGIVAVAAGLAACSPDNDAVAKVPGGEVVYSFYTEPLKEMTFTQTILDSPGRGNVFWGTEFEFNRTVYGYTGFQSWKSGDGQFLFSVWGATASSSSNPNVVCSPFEENGKGYGCHIVTRPITGHTYKFHLKERSPGYYGVEVTDVTAGTSFDLGQVRIEPDLEISGTQVRPFTEYFDWNNTNTRCGDEPYSRLVNEAPTTIYNGKVKTASYIYFKISSDCPGASKIMIHGDQAVQEYGIGNSPGGELINQANGLCADVMNGSSEAGAQLIQYPCNNGSNQVFVFAADGTLHTQTHCLDAGSSPPDGAPLVLAECNGSATQQWKLYPYGIESHGGLTIGVEDYSTSSGARLIVKKIDYSNYPYETKWTFNTEPSQ
ncbi:hypothetical protein PA598K_01695 [Paenibacillus sp. 598K]|uniref:RICIN domain-containing protein n=1 Tax=Paenibacillus sp. 598K TaxID=1117987 RepID=UPI000FFA1517|nr:ricin-type beta-trefoil lectin domain protein [Paenibacillus sp. 598K]GBF73406.1 hypothetical protein PA598K_01695 [Paenibacillus sp. 598K]